MTDKLDWLDEPAAAAMHLQRRSDNASARGKGQAAALYAIAAGVFAAVDRLDALETRLTHIRNVLSKLDPSG